MKTISLFDFLWGRKTGKICQDIVRAKISINKTTHRSEKNVDREIFLVKSVGITPQSTGLNTYLTAISYATSTRKFVCGPPRIHISL